MLATLVDAPFVRDGWVFETKLDGIRCVAQRSGRDVVLWSRNRNRLNERFPELARALQEQDARDFIVDGEIVVLRDGITSFQALQQRSAGTVWYYAFDLLRIDGRDIRTLPLLDRKALLHSSLKFRSPLRYSKHRDGDGVAMYEEACGAGLEGLIAKDASAPYVSGRSRAWLKIKCVNAQEFVIGGYTDPLGSRTGFGALLVGYYDGEEFRYAGKVGTGFNVETLRGLGHRMKTIARDTSPFAESVPGVRRAHWVTPKLVVQVGFTEWTSGGRLRHPRFEGVREDKKAAEVVRERPRG